MFPDLTTFQYLKEGSMAVSSTSTEIRWTWLGTTDIGAQSYFKNLDVTDINHIKGHLVTGNSYSNTDKRWKIYIGIMPLSFNPSTTFVGASNNNPDLYVVKFTYETRNSETDFDIDVSSLSGEYNLVLSVVGWTVTISNLEYVTEESYTVQFNANGGTGTMNNQTIVVNVTTPLNTNLFTREHHTFAGWALSSTGEIEYTDGADVLNLGEDGDVIILYAIWTLVPYYTVTFNANGGTGTMANQEINTDVPTHLSLNTFTRDEYIFQGWAKTAIGSVMYTDGEEVTNIGESGTTVTLYAIWKKAPIPLTLQTNNSEKNKLDKDITNIETVYGTLRSECSIIDPVITFSADLNVLKSCNYMTIPKFGRSYFVTNIRSIREGLVELSAHVDVLSSFKSQIRSNKAIIGKSENEWNLYLNDGSLKTYQNSRIFTKEFPSGFSTQSFVLAIAGS